MILKKKKKTTTKKSKIKYITGTHISSKCSKPINYRSGYELSVIKVLDEDPNVLCYSYESIGIPYFSPSSRSKKIRRYFPDFFVSYMDGTKLIIEVKRDDQINNIWVKAKAKACKEWAEKAGIKYQIWGTCEIAQAQLSVLEKKVQTKKQLLFNQKKK
jgi:hypothetical protein